MHPLLKTIRFLSIPAACFATAWLATSWLVSLREDTYVEGTVPGAGADIRPRIRQQTEFPQLHAARFREELLGVPLERWSAAWHEFADHATADDLQRLAGMEEMPGRFSLKTARVVPSLLAAEELALRASEPKPLTHGAMAVIAKNQPGRAWEMIRKGDKHSLAALRALATKVPREALESCLELLASSPRFRHWCGDDYHTGGFYPKLPDNCETRCMTASRSPLGAVFGAWARTDPAGALKALQWKPNRAGALVSIVACVFPEKAAALARVLPPYFVREADASHTAPAGRGEVAALWPDAFARQPSWRVPMDDSSAWQYDPLGVARLGLEYPELFQSGYGSEKVIGLIAERDPQLARQWIERFSDKRRNEHEKIFEQTMARHSRAPSPDDLARAESASPGAWASAVRHLIYQGGDWRKALERAPFDDGRVLLDNGSIGQLRSQLAEEGKLAERLRTLGK